MKREEEKLILERLAYIQDGIGGLHRSLGHLAASIRHLERLISQLLSSLFPSRFTIRIIQEVMQENTIMAVGTITAGTPSQFGSALLDNGAVFVPPAGSTYVFSPTFTADDPGATFAPATVDASGGTIPLSAQTVVTLPVGDTATSVTITATATAPDGTVSTGKISVPAAQQFTIAVTQLS